MVGDLAMNKNFSQIYDQALVIEGNGNYVSGELDPVKFAELIIKECIDVAFDRGDNVDYLKQHFGLNDE
jgi:hypothetical protein